MSHRSRPFAVLLLVLACAAAYAQTATDPMQTQSQLLQQLARNAIERRAWAEAVEHLDKAAKLPGARLSPEAELDWHTALLGVDRPLDALAPLLRFIRQADPASPRYAAAPALLDALQARLERELPQAKKRVETASVARQAALAAEHQRNAQEAERQRIAVQEREALTRLRARFTNPTRDAGYLDASVHDAETQLTWLPGNPHRGASALAARKICESVGWRLATVNEMQMLLDPRHEGARCGDDLCALPSNFRTLPSPFAWASETQRSASGERQRLLVDLRPPQTAGGLARSRWESDTNAGLWHSVLCVQGR